MKKEHRANLPKTGHDLSHSFDYTSPVGAVIPVFSQLMEPGDTISLKIDPTGSRTQPLSQSAYVDMDIHEEYYFVPFSCLLTKFSDFIYQTNNTYSSSISDLLQSTQLPALDLYKLHRDIYNNVNKIGFGSIAFDCYGKGLLRLLDQFGMLCPVTDSDGFFDDEEAPTGSFFPKVFPYKLLAYNCIYQYFFRMDDWEKFNPKAFNVDQFTDSQEISFSLPRQNDGDEEPTNPYFRLFFRPLIDDYFTSMSNSPIVTITNVLGEPARLPLQVGDLTRNPDNGNGIYLNQTQVQTSGSWQQSPSSSRVNTGIGLSQQNSSQSLLNGADVNTANLRAMFANEKFWRITGMSDKTYDAQTLAHYGFKVPVDVMHQPQRIGHDIYPLRIGEVISTATTTEQPLGTVAGKGYVIGQNNRGCKFTAPCHGVVMALQSISLKPSYITPFLRDSAVVDWSDFFQPEFDHLGMQPLYNYETVQNVGNTFPYILGWQYRYNQFKRKFNRSSQAFIGSQPWITTESGPFSDWNVSGQPFSGIMGANRGIPKSFYYFYLSPRYTDKIFQIIYNTNVMETDSVDGFSLISRPSIIYSEDPIVFHTRISSKLVSVMSKFSEPRLD